MANKDYYPIEPLYKRNQQELDQFPKPEKTANLGYREYVSDFYEGYPGGVDAAIAEARQNRAKYGEFDSKEDKAIAPKLDDWTLNRKNPSYGYKDKPGSRPGHVIGGRAFIDSIKDKAGRTFSELHVYGLDHLRSDPLNRFQQKYPYNPMSEEMVHGAQPYGGGQYYDIEGDFGDRGGQLPYAARNKEMGAKLTNMKHDYIRRNWPKDGSGRTDKFNRNDAKAILDKVQKGGGHVEDYGMKQLLYQNRNSKGESPGLKYMKENEEHFKDFLESTVQNKRPAGLFTGRGPQNA